jgi:hypothetical protein
MYSFNKCNYKLCASWLWWINKWSVHDYFTIAVDSTDQREDKWQRAREKYISMLAEKKRSWMQRGEKVTNRKMLREKLLRKILRTSV